MEPFETIRRNAEEHPRKTFLAWHGASITYEETLCQTARLARRILEAGTRDRPCLVKADGAAACIGILACLSLGKPFVVVNPKSPRDRFEYYQKDSGSNVLVFDSAADADSVHSIERQLLVETVECPSDPWSTVGDSSRIACLIYTSGSTGQPKAVVCPADAVAFATQAIRQSLCYRSDDVILTALPLFFDFGLYQLFLAGQAGASLYFASELENSVGLSAALKQTGATILPMVPPAAEKLARLTKRGLARHKVRMVTTTGAALDPDVRLVLTNSWDEAVDVRVMYGLTECKRVAIMPAFEPHRHTQASGIPLEGTTVTIRPHGNDTVLAADSIGEICVQGPHVMNGYHNQPELTSQRFQRTSAGIVLRTGDTGFVDSKGHLHCLGRDDSQFKVRGYRVSSSEVAIAARSAGDVESVAVIPPKPGRTYTLFFEGAADEELVIRTLHDQLEPFSIPVVVKRLPRLPKNANGKIDMKELERKAENGQQRATEELDQRSDRKRRLPV